MDILDRLNLFKRIKDAEDAEERLSVNLFKLTDSVEKLFSDMNDLENGVEKILSMIDKKTETIKGLNARIFEMSQSQYYTSIDIPADLDAGIGDVGAT